VRPRPSPGSACAGRLLSFNPRVSLASGGGWEAPPLRILRAGTGGERNSAPPCKPLAAPPALAFANHANQVRDFRNWRPLGLSDCGNPWLRSKPTPKNLKGGRLPDGIRRSPPTSGPRSRPGTPTSTSATDKQAFSRGLQGKPTYRFQSQSSDGQALQPGRATTGDAASGPRMNNRPSNWESGSNSPKAGFCPSPPGPRGARWTQFRARPRTVFLP